MQVSGGITDAANTANSGRLQRNPKHRPSSLNNRHKALQSALPSHKLLNTYCHYNGSNHAPTTQYTLDTQYTPFKLQQTSALGHARSWPQRCPPPLTSIWPHLRCDVGLEEGEYRENCLYLAVLCTIIMVHKDMSSSYRSVNCIRL